jgi:glycosyltransferase involved in cell wall biosynthesis
MRKVLYITRNGLLEPLGQSQILSYLVPLSKSYKFYIISFEKEEDYKNIEHLKRIKSICESNNIVWKPLHYKKGSRKLGVLVGFIDLVKSCMSIVKKEKINIIHARSYFTCFIALFLNKLYKVPFIFDMRALWPEELVEAGRLKKNGVAWKGIKFLEKKCLNKAAAVVSLTYAAVEYLDKMYVKSKLKEKTTVIPTCADLKRFKLKESNINKNSITISCVGSMLTGWFKIDMLKIVIHYILENYQNVSFEFLTRDDEKKLLSKLDLIDKHTNRIELASVLFKDMPQRIAKHDGSIFFFTADISKLGSAPTRMAELLGTGVPVLTNSGVGDVGSIITSHKVGVLVNSDNGTDLKLACDKFISLVKQKDIDKLCRDTAEKLFSLQSGVEKYKAIYDEISYDENEKQYIGNKKN